MVENMTKVPTCMPVLTTQGSPRHQIPDCKCFLGHRSSCTPPEFQHIKRIKLNSTGLQGHASQFPLRLSNPVTLHFTGVDGFWPMSKPLIT